MSTCRRDGSSLSKIATRSPVERAAPAVCRNRDQTALLPSAPVHPALVQPPFPATGEAKGLAAIMDIARPTHVLLGPGHLVASLSGFGHLVVKARLVEEALKGVLVGVVQRAMVVGLAHKPAVAGRWTTRFAPQFAGSNWRSN